MPIKLCIQPGCAGRAVYRGRCAEHARRRECEIKRAGRALYRTKRWRMTRRAVLATQPVCECGELTTDVHHKVDIADGGDPWAPENLEALCHSCHSRLTRAGQG